MKFIFVHVFLIVFINELFSHVLACQKKIGGTICYEDSEYPAETISEAWNKLNRDTRMTFGNFMEYESEEQHIRSACKLCETSVSMRIQPVSFLGKDKVYVMSSERYPRPWIDVSTCREDAVCELELPNDFYTECKQRMSTINVLAFNATSTQFQGVPLVYPSGCECILRIDDTKKREV